MLSGVLQRQGLKARSLPSDAISAAHIVSLQASKTKLVCLSYLGTGANAAHVRYLVRRLRRILPEGATVLVGFWADDGGGAALKALEATAEADAYATSLKEAARFCIDAARGHDVSKSKALAKGETLPAGTVASNDDEASTSEKAAKDEKTLAKTAPAKDEKAPARRLGLRLSTVAYRFGGASAAAT
jgi:hypothetical protein